MTLRRLQFGLLISVVILASCVPTPNPEEFDWCYYYNFSIFDYGASVINGEWVDGEGFISDSEDPNALVFSITKSGLSVQPLLVSLTVARPDGVEGWIAASGLGSIYEADAKIDSSNLAPEWTEQTLWSENSDGDYGNLIYIEIQSDQPLAVTGISVHGNGPTPFDVNPCAPATPTAVATETTEGTSTPTPTITLTPTITNTPTPACAVEADVSIPVTAGPGSVTVYGGGPTGWPYIVQLTAGNPHGTDYYITPALSGYNPWSGYDFSVRGARLTVARTNTAATTVSGVQVVLVDSADTYITSGQTNMQGFSWPYTAGGGNVFGTATTDLNGEYPPLQDVEYVKMRFAYYAGGGFTASGSKGMYINSIIVRMCREELVPTPTATVTPTHTYTPTPTRTPLLGPGTPTPTRTVPAVNSPTPQPNSPTPPITNTPGPSNTPPPTNTLIPLPSAIASQTIEATYPVPGFTGIPGPTVVSTLGGFPTVESIGHSGVYDLLSTAAAELDNLPSDLGAYIPDPDVTQVLGYIKWGISCVSLYEALGENVGTMGCHAATGLVLFVVILAVWVSVKVIQFILRTVLKIISFIAGFIPGL